MHVNYFIRSWLFLGMLTLCCGCTSFNRKSQIKDALVLAGNNRSSLEAVLQHFPPKSEGCQAAQFLIANMTGHKHLQSALMDSFYMALPVTRKNTEVNEIWQTVSQRVPDSTQYENDLEHVTADFLLRQIQESLNTWKTASWHNEVPFEIFCRYILPYKVCDEALTDWRTPLYNRFIGVVDTIHDLKIAFETLYTQIDKSFQDLYIACPYPRDPLITDKARIGNCHEKAVFMTYAMRSVGIPAAVDMNCNWGNYGNESHEWVVLVLSDGNSLHIAPDGKLGDAEQPIDASVLPYTVAFDESHASFQVDTLKTTAKAYRRMYDLYPPISVEKTEMLHDFFCARHIFDVSDQYDMSYSLRLTVPKRKSFRNVYLCTFSHGMGWHPAAITQIKHGKAIFSNLGGGIVYLPTFFNGRRMIPLGNPIVIHRDGSKQRLVPNVSEKQTVRLSRKYILMGHWIDRWTKLIGNRIEVSVNGDFNNATLLHDIQEIPYGLQRISIPEALQFRYLRWTTPVQDSSMRYQVANIAEIGCFTKTDSGFQKIDAAISAQGNSIDPIQDNVKVIADGKNLTATTWRYPYTIVMDLGTTIHGATEFRYMPATDANFVEHHQYELFYFDGTWVSIGKQYADLDELVFDNVPRGALLWLQDVTQGEEERIFTYENGRQRWW